jgi:hypothetical protein
LLRLVFGARAAQLAAAPLLLLVALRELTATDWQALRRVVSRGKKRRAQDRGPALNPTGSF